MPAKLNKELMDKAVLAYQNGESSHAVSKRLGFGKDALLKELKRRGLRSRSKAEALALKYEDAVWRDKDKLEQLYIVEGMSSHEIAAKLNCDRSVITDWLHRHGIPVRSLSEAHIGQIPGNAGKGKRYCTETVLCACGCGTELRRYAYGSYERRFVSGHRIKGEAHPLYKKESVNKKPRHGRSDYRLWRQAVLKERDYTCARCGKRGGKLHAHHVLPMAKFPEYAFSVKNGRAMCVPCHRDLHSFANEVAR
jgi:thymidylate synthase (FAD)